MTIPEAHYFDLPWAGSYLILGGLCLMALGFLTEKSLTRRVAIAIAVLLLALFAVYPVFALTNSMPYLSIEAIGVNVYSIVYACSSVCFLVLLVLLGLSRRIQVREWINEKESEKRL